MLSRRSSFPCPVCGEVVPANALACPECGACEKSGWSSNAQLDGLDLPDEEFDYDQFANEEFGAAGRPASGRRFWWVTGVLLVIALVCGTIGGCFFR